MSEEELQQHFDDFYEDIFTELATKYGEVDEMNICDNIGDHLLGNVYIKFRFEEDALKCVENLNERFYEGKIFISLFPAFFFVFFFLSFY